MKETTIIQPLETLRQDWQEVIFNLMSIGASKEEVMAELDLSKRTFYKYLKEEPEFRDAIRRGETLSEAWWRRLGREKAVYHPKGDRLDPQIFRLNMQNRFGWVGDNQKVDYSGEIEHNHTLKREEIKNLPDADLDQRLAEGAKREPLRLASGR